MKYFFEGLMFCMAVLKRTQIKSKKKKKDEKIIFYLTEKQSLLLRVK